MDEQHIIQITVEVEFSYFTLKVGKLRCIWMLYSVHQLHEPGVQYPCAPEFRLLHTTLFSGCRYPIIYTRLSCS